MLRPTPRRRGRLLAVAALATAACAALPAAAPAARTPPRCTVSTLLGELTRPQAGAGQRFVTLVLTNVTRRACSLGGYPGGLLLGARNNALPTNVVRMPDVPVRTVVLAPGKSAKSTLQWGAIAGTGDRQRGTCQPTPARIEITPPNAAQHLVLPWRLGPVCERGRIVVTPMTRA